MNHISFEVGDRVRHKLTQIQGEIMQLEQSLAMPHAWVIEPSVCDVNPPTLYRLIDLEKVENSGKKAQTTNQAQGVNPKISLSDRSLEGDSSTSNDFFEESVPTLPNGTTTVSTEPESSVLTVEEEKTTVSTEPESSVLTVEQELITVHSKSVSGEQIASKPLPISVKSSSNRVGNTSTSNELPCQQDLTVTSDITTISTELESQVLTVENDTTTVSTKDQSQDLTVENQTTTVSTKFALQDLTVENDTTEGVSNSTTQRSNNRRKGKGTGRIQLRTITKQNGKQYQQFWYDWQVHTSERTIYKSVYIPKRLVKKIQALESAKAPVLEILEVLGVVRK